MMTGPQRDVAADLLERNERVSADFAAALTGLADRQIEWRPAAGGWSIAELLEHLCISADSYLVTLLQKRGANYPTATETTEWRPSLLGGLLANSLRSARKLPAPRIYRPGPEPRTNVAQEFLVRQREVSKLIEASEGIEWRKVRSVSPVSRFIRINLGDCFQILVAHAERHLGQLRRIKADPTFPSSG